MTLTVTLVNGSKRGAHTRDQLLRLLSCFDLSRWQFTDHVQIAERVIPHSHPVLTLNTAELTDDACLLAVYLHEQLHWYTLTKPDGQQAVTAAMRERYPDLPIARPAGCGSEQSNHIHLLVCPLEFLGIADLLGEAEARRVIASHPYYTALYALILRDSVAIRALFARYAYGP